MPMKSILSFFVLKCKKYQRFSNECFIFLPLKKPYIGSRLLKSTAWKEITTMTQKYAYFIQMTKSICELT